MVLKCGLLNRTVFSVKGSLWCFND